MQLKKGDTVRFEAEISGDPDDGKKAEVLSIKKNPPDLGGGIGVRICFLDTKKERDVLIDECSPVSC